MKKLIYILIVSILLTGCGLMKKTSEKETSKTTSKTESVVKNDSTSTTNTNVTVSEGIKDKIVTNVPKSDTGDSKLDSLVNRKMDILLSQLNSQKRSGSNSYTMRFDKATRQLITEFEIGRTKDSIRIAEMEQRMSETNNTEYSEILKSEAKKVIRTLPWWIWVIVAWVFRKTIFNTIAMIFPQFGAFKIVKRIVNPIKP